jgi:hypothetical protein
MKLDIDTMLKDWPAPARPDSSWDERADAIVNAARVHKEEAEWGDEGALAAGQLGTDALFAAPNLPPEPGEPTTFGASGSEPAMLRVAGDSKMSEKQPERSVPPPSSQAVSGPRSKRGSLREMAERHSTRTPMATPLPGSITAPSISTPLPSSPLSTPMPPPLSARSPLSTPLPRPSMATPIPGRPSEAGKDDSGIVNLDQIRSNVTREQEEAAAAARPASQGLFEDDDDKAAAGARAPSSAMPASAKAPASARAAAPPATKKSSGATAGIVIAILGLAAAFAITQRGRIMQYVSPPPIAEAPVAEAPVEAAPVAEAPVEPPPAAEAPEAAADPAAAPVAEAPAPVAVGGPLPRPGPAAAPPAAGAPAPGKPAATADPKAAATPAVPGKPGDLASEMAKAVGSDGKPIEGAEKPEPASGGKTSGSVPEQPPQGSVSAAVGSVMGAAKACVGGADDVSKATITFGSNGAVKSVAVTGWAAANGASGCVKSALQGANVGAFSKPSFTVGVTIRP